MARLIKRTNRNYTNVSNAVIRDSRLSWKARGIFVYLWSQADNWDFYVSEIAKHATDGVRALRNGLKELEKLGYLIRKNKQAKEGGFDGMEWILIDHPGEHHSQNSDDAKKAQNHGEKCRNASDAKCIGRKMRWTQKGTLRTTNNKNYQYKELPTIRNNSRAEPNNGSAHSTHLAERKEIIAYLNNKLGTSYRAGAKKNAERMNARLNEGYTVDDFKKVIDNKYADWADSPKMARYLRPETLFSPKFEGYLNEKQVTSGNQDESDYEASLREWNEGD